MIDERLSQWRRKLVECRGIENKIRVHGRRFT